MCRSIWTRAGSRGTRGPSRPSARCILRATRSRTGIFSARSWAAGSSGRRWGDIYVSEGSCDFLVTREILPYLLQNFLSAGRTKLHVEQLPIDQIRVPEQKVKAVRDTVSSLRLDGVVSSGFSISRGKAADYIAAGKCELNYAPCMKGDKQAVEGDVITIRGLGKIRLETIGGSTKKGRIAIEITRFL